jgi:uncharacterized membrane protein required for colicin V production
VRAHADRILGILLGIVLGVAIVAAFVFLGSRDTIDSPSIDEQTPTQTAPAPQQPQTAP